MDVKSDLNLNLDTKIVGASQVGIGTASPATILNVVKNQNAETNIEVSNNSSGSLAVASFVAKNDSSGYAQYGAVSSTNTDLGGIFANRASMYSSLAGGLILFVDAVADIIFGTNSAEVMRISSLGNMGVGVAPSATSKIKAAGVIESSTGGFKFPDGSTQTTASTGGAAVTDATIATTDVTTNNATTLKHGWLPKLGGGTSNFLRADGAWAAPPSGTGGGATFATTTLNMGTIGIATNANSVTVSVPTITTASIVNCWLVLEATADHDMDDLINDPIQLSCGNIVNATGFTIYGKMPVGTAWGNYKIGYSVA